MRFRKYELLQLIIVVYILGLLIAILVKHLIQ